MSEPEPGTGVGVDQPVKAESCPPSLLISGPASPGSRTRDRYAVDEARIERIREFIRIHAPGPVSPLGSWDRFLDRTCEEVRSALLAARKDEIAKITASLEEDFGR